MRIALKVNGSTHEVEVAPADTLLTVLRDALDLTGTLPFMPRELPGSTSQA
jgi:aerobic-type carbon monoxide dehydrogenase small subunit (CoxS/CutS family)